MQYSFSQNAKIALSILAAIVLISVIYLIASYEVCSNNVNYDIDANDFNLKDYNNVISKYGNPSIKKEGFSKTEYLEWNKSNYSFTTAHSYEDKRTRYISLKPAGRFACEPGQFRTTVKDFLSQMNINSYGNLIYSGDTDRTVITITDIQGWESVEAMCYYQRNDAYITIYTKGFTDWRRIVK